MKKLILVMLGAAVACPCRSAVICSADSQATFVDSRRGVRYEAGTNAVHTLTYTTYLGGVAQEEIYSATFSAIDVTGLGLPGLQRVTFTGSISDTRDVRLDGAGRGGLAQGSTAEL